ncbi:hypothetical protein J6590_031825 [Homalodisca vitripennis]|nr:hypothetical protein J6590_031825 [Homalodisca vitripennis]
MEEGKSITYLPIMGGGLRLSPIRGAYKAVKARHAPAVGQLTADMVRHGDNDAETCAPMLAVSNDSITRDRA